MIDPAMGITALCSFAVAVLTLAGIGLLADRFRR